MSASPGELIDKLCLVNIYLREQLQVICAADPNTTNVAEQDLVERVVVAHAQLSLDRARLIKDISACLAASPRLGEV